MAIGAADAASAGSMNQGAVDAGNDAAPVSSCAPGGPGMTNCGAGGSGIESCCTSLEVTGGTFFRIYNQSFSPGDHGALAEAPATVSTFSFDKYLVTVGRFRQFVGAWGTGWLPAAGSGKHAHLNDGNGLAAAAGGYEPGWIAVDDSNVQPTNNNLASCSPYSTWTSSAGSQENLPINCVNWWEAYAFCIWDGGFLPSQAEWEYAAAGGSQQRVYPWGASDPGGSSDYAIYNCFYPDYRESPSFGGNCSVMNVAPVGYPRFGAGLWGQLDLGGEVSEWNMDWNGLTTPCKDCANLSGTERGPSGGNFSVSDNFMHPWDQSTAIAPTVRDLGIGIRCARTP